MLPEYVKLARKMKKENENLLVAKIDATANDLHPMLGEIKGYPTLFFLPASNKEDIIQYQQGSFAYKSLKVLRNNINHKIKVINTCV